MAEPLSEHTGGCACGAVRYTFVGEPGFSFLCQCRRCQRSTGTGHAPGFRIKWDDVKITGKTNTYTETSDSGFPVSHHFCGSCGSPIYSATGRDTGSIAIYAGSLDDPTIYKPQRVIYRSSGQPWDFTDPALHD